MGDVFSKKNNQGGPGSEEVGQILKKTSKLKNSSITVRKMRGWQIWKARQSYI
jgi:hypothetical protein